jgi:hypothetical protein
MTNCYYCGHEVSFKGDPHQIMGVVVIERDYLGNTFQHEHIWHRACRKVRVELGRITYEEK